MGKRGQQQRSSKSSQEPRLVEALADSDSDEEIPEDEAFDSDDERKYGCFFEDKKVDDDGPSGSEESGEDEGDEGDDDDEDEESDESGDEEKEGLSESSDNDDVDEEDESDGEDSESDGGDGGQYMLDLLDKIDDNKKVRVENPKLASVAIAKHTKESEFSASVLPKANLTLDALLKGSEDTQGFGVVQKQLKAVAQGAPTTAPLARVVSERIKRKVHYEDEAKDVSRWIQAVQENRRAETLDFRPKERMELTKDVMVENFVPTTDFEKQIHQALMDAGRHDEEAILRAEQAAMDDLGANEITLEEFKKRRGHLAKMRALMFYQERKNHQIKKIKSKTYRRIRKRQRERAKTADIEDRAQDDEELVRELEEKEEVERMKERMTLAHKNTSKWAKRVLKRGKNVDLDTRRALSAQLKRGDDLLQRMNTTRAGAKGEDDDSDEDLVKAARKVLAETEGNDKPGEEAEGLFKLAFMQKGVERQRQQAREEARELLRELEAREDDDSVDGDGNSNGDDEELQTKAKKAPRKVASKVEMRHVLGQDELVASQLKFGNSDKMAVSGEIRIDNGSNDNAAEPLSVPTTGAISVHHTTLGSHEDTQIRNVDAASDLPSDGTKSKSQRKRKESVPSTAESNPWLVSQEAKGPEKQVKKRKGALVDVEQAIELLEPAVGAKATVANKATTATPGETSILSLTQEQLVKRAFATVDEKDVDAEFAKEKEAVAEEEDPTTRERNKKSLGGGAMGADGWGSWAGKGAMPPSKPPRKLPTKLRAPDKK